MICAMKRGWSGPPWLPRSEIRLVRVQCDRPRYSEVDGGLGDRGRIALELELGRVHADDLEALTAATYGRSLWRLALD